VSFCFRDIELCVFCFGWSGFFVILNFMGEEIVFCFVFGLLDFLFFVLFRGHGFNSFYVLCQAFRVFFLFPGTGHVP